MELSVQISQIKKKVLHQPSNKRKSVKLKRKSYINHQIRENCKKEGAWKSSGCQGGSVDEAGNHQHATWLLCMCLPRTSGIFLRVFPISPPTTFSSIVTVHFQIQAKMLTFFPPSSLLFQIHKSKHYFVNSINGSEKNTWPFFVPLSVQYTIEEKKMCTYRWDEEHFLIPKKQMYKISDHFNSKACWENVTLLHR